MVKEEKKVTRCNYLKYTDTAIGGLVVGEALGYLSKPAEVIEKTVTASGVTTTVERMVTITVTRIPITSPTLSPTTTTQWGASLKSASLNVLSSPSYANFLKYAADKFMKIYSQVTINVIPMPWKALYPKILSDLQSKTDAYDLFTMIDVMTLSSVVSTDATSLDMIMKKYSDIVDSNLDILDFEPTFGYGSVWAREDSKEDGEVTGG